MNKKSLQIRTASVIIITLFVLASCKPIIAAFSDETNQIEIEENVAQEDVIVTYYSFGLHEQSTKEIKMSYSEVEELFDIISDYSEEIAYDP